MNLKMKYLLNKKISKTSMRTFEGISNGRKKALDNWFCDKWAQVDNIKDSLLSLEDNEDIVNKYLAGLVKEYEEFCEIFILDSDGKVVLSSCITHIGLDMSYLPNFKAGKEGRQLMYGPYIDENTLDTDIKGKKFFDEVTLMFSNVCKNHQGELRILCCRVLNDDMSNVIQDEDSHIYKNSGDNYLFMVKSNRGIEPGTAISRSRFEDDTFTFGENLKDGVNTKKWGKVKIKKHTEFEIIFKDPATNSLHQGVANTIKNGENLDCWPGYPDYRHIMVGGKGTLITPPHCDEVWGMMCEGDIDEIYDFKGISLKIPGYISILCAVLLGGTEIVRSIMPDISIAVSIIDWLIISTASIIICNKYVKNPLIKTLDILQDIAEGEGNLTKRVSKMSNDEIGELSRWFNKFINNQMTMLIRIKKSFKTNKNSVGIVSEITNEVKEGMANIEGTVVSLLENSKEQNSVFQKTRDKFSHITASIQEMNSLILEISSVIQDTNDNSINANKSSDDVLKNMKDLNVVIKKTVSAIEDLQRNSKEITNVINMINDISEQTQLLALNASIEAAKAGEEGKGFSVVAQEISKLATESQQATKSVDAVINSIQRHTESAFEYAEEINSKVDISMKKVSQSMELFNVVNEDVNLISESMKSITKITENQNNDVSEVMNNVSAMADKINKTTENNSNMSEESLNIVKGILLEIRQLKNATNALEYSSENMDEMVSSFKLS
ncbi:methyl-accepting chemotaxis protein [uncultured Clostridium sp.]|uniref:methyl-accepting chemotaxis protein n=1 Tax=uncultured Clostridium sp. TaxID=59620 RepID=UPI0025FA54A7|nr:HAMP domain-containing methyl-accepting chemotaxis protein [uncultured Clostridium sp.]